MDEKLVNIYDYDYRTPLHIAAGKGLNKLVKLYIGCGALVNPCDRWRKSPLHDAVVNRHSETAKILLSFKASLGIDNEIELAIFINEIVT